MNIAHLNHFVHMCNSLFQMQSSVVNMVIEHRNTALKTLIYNELSCNSIFSVKCSTANETDTLLIVACIQLQNNSRYYNT